MAPFSLGFGTSMKFNHLLWVIIFVLAALLVAVSTVVSESISDGQRIAVFVGAGALGLLVVCQLLAIAFLKCFFPSVPFGKPPPRPSSLSRQHSMSDSAGGPHDVEPDRLASLEELPASVRPRTRWDAPTSPSSCPVCKGAIERGSVSVHGTVGGFLMVGASYQHCWFKSREGREDIVIASGKATPGFRCGGCGFVGIYNMEDS